MSIPLLFVCSEKDFIKFQTHIEKYKELISDNIIVIGKSSLQKLCNTDKGITFYDEDKIFPGLSFASVKDVIKQRNPNTCRTGWYFQQFLKMAYALICEQPYYLIWDADTIPLKKYNTDVLSFDVKTEYRKAYFDTINKLFPELSKKNKYSFIAEHMMIDVSVMKEMIYKINKIDNTKSFWINILECVADGELSGAGFSEFETYGTYTKNYYPKLYKIQKWHSLRDGNNWLTYDMVDDRLEKWLVKKFEAISFDNWQDFDQKKSDFYLKYSKYFSYDVTKFLFRLQRKVKKLLKKT